MSHPDPLTHMGQILAQARAAFTPNPAAVALTEAARRRWHRLSCEGCGADHPELRLGYNDTPLCSACAGDDFPDMQIAQGAEE